MAPQKPESVGDVPTISDAPNIGDSPTALDSRANGGDTRATTIGDTNATLANAAGAGAVPPRTSAASDHSSTIGHYRILRLLGEGGMGSVYLLGASLAGKKKYAEAEPLLLEGYRGMLARKDRVPVPNWHYLDSVHAWIVQLYKAWGKPEKAAAWKQQH